MNLKNESHKTVQQFLALFVFGLTLFTCVGPEEPYEYDPPATEILRIELTPDTLIMGDTLFIRCVVKDSLDPAILFSWGLASERIVPVNGKTDSSVIRWHAGNLNLFGNKPDSVKVTSVGGWVNINKIVVGEEFAQVMKSFNIFIKRKNTGI